MDTNKNLKHEDLRVYKNIYDLLTHFYKISSNFSKDYRYTLAEKIKNELLETLIIIYQANIDFKERKENISQAQKKVEKIRIYIRLLKDLEQINLKKFIFLNQKIDIIKLQLLNWHKKSP